MPGARLDGARFNDRACGHNEIHIEPGRYIVVGFLLYMVVIGIVAGFVARLLVPGRDPMGFFATLVLGVVGSFIGGFLGYVLFGKDLNEGALQPSGIVGSIIGAVIALLIYRAVSRSHRRGLVR
jgi:uncharacterized membrane protein YeaQ/YmgE (transglycosylase-associated protein family)